MRTTLIYIDSLPPPTFRAISSADVIVKDTKRYADTNDWSFYNFNHHEPKAPAAKLRSKEQCAFCHIASAKRDDVWTQFYPLLDSGYFPRAKRSSWTDPSTSKRVIRAGQLKATWRLARGTHGYSDRNSGRGHLILGSMDFHAVGSHS